MELKNKLGLEGLAFQFEEERISKQKAKRLYDEHVLDTFEVGTYAGLQSIHRGCLKTSMISPGKPAG
jgi:cell filamentation protein